MKIASVKPKFVEYIPDTVDDGHLYISLEHGTAVHNCCCGCGREVITPLGPTGWRVTRDGDLISLTPSIGSWNLPCRSHYWISRNQISWAEQWSDKQIKAAREHERIIKDRHFNPEKETTTVPPQARLGFWARLIKWFLGS